MGRVEEIDRELAECDLALWTELDSGREWALDAFTDLSPSDWDTLGDLWVERGTDWQEKLVRSIEEAPEDRALALLDAIARLAPDSWVRCVASEVIDAILGREKRPPPPEPSYDGPGAREVLDRLLGSYPFGDLREFSGVRPGYVCIAFERPENGGFFVDIEAERGIADDGMAWETYAVGGSQAGHAWDDNSPDAPVRPEPFPNWVERHVLSMFRYRVERWLPEQWPKLSGSDGSLGVLRDASSLIVVAIDAESPEAWQKDVLLLATACHAKVGDQAKAEALVECVTPHLGAADIVKGSTLLRCIDTTRGLDTLRWWELLQPALEDAAAVRRTAPAQWGQLCDLLCSSGAAAMAAFGPIATRTAGSADNARVAAVAFGRRGDHMTAAALLAQADELHPGQHDIRANLRDAYLAAGRPDLAATVEVPPAADTPALVAKRERIAATLAQRRLHTANRPELRILQRLLPLEAVLNDLWRSARIMPVEQAIAESRFSKEASAVVARWLRDLAAWDEAVKWLNAELADLELITLCYRSDALWTGDFLERAFGCFIDSRDPANWALGISHAERILALPFELQSSGVYWMFACLYALTGDKGTAAVHAASAVEFGAPADELWEDPDLESLRIHAHFRNIAGRPYGSGSD